MTLYFVSRCFVSIPPRPQTVFGSGILFSRCPYVHPLRFGFRFLSCWLIYQKEVITLLGYLISVAFIAPFKRQKAHVKRRNTEHKTQNIKLKSQTWKSQVSNTKHTYTKHNVKYRLPYFRIIVIRRSRLSSLSWAAVWDHEYAIQSKRICTTTFSVITVKWHAILVIVHYALKSVFKITVKLQG